MSSVHASSHRKDSTLAAVATSTLPHMKVIIVRLLFPKEGKLDGLPGKYPLPRVVETASSLSSRL